MTAQITPRQLTLDELAEIANEEHHQCEAAIGGVVQHAIKAGAALTSAKERISHGEWQLWLASHFEGSGRQARAYMQVARKWQSSAILPDSLAQALRPLIQDEAPHVANNSGENEWYTPRDYIEPARGVLGEIDLDPASNARANEVVGARDYFSIDDDGLAHDWYGRVWMNPPYAADLVGKFADKMVESYRAGSVLASITLVNNATETAWFQALARTAAAICFPERRIRFWSPDGELGAPLQGQALIYMGLEPERFAEAFAPFGLIVTVEAHA